MPTVPTLQSTERTQPLQPGLASPQVYAMGGQQAQQLGQAVSGLEQDLARIQVREDADKVFQATAGLQSEALTLHNDIAARQGQNAYGATTDATKWWDEAGRRYADQLQPGEQRRAFDRQFSQMRLDSLRFTSGHEASERRKSVEQSANAVIDNAVSAAAANYADPAIIASNRSTVDRTVRATAAANGWTPEITQDKMAEAMSSLHMGVITAQVEASPAAAKAYYAENKTEIAGKYRPKLEEMLKSAGLRAASQASADRIYSEGGDLQTMLIKAREIKDPERRDATVQRIKARVSDDETAQRRQEAEAASEGWKVIAGGGSVDDIPTALWVAMDGQTQMAFRNYAAKRSEGAAVKTDFATWYGLQQQAIADPKAFSRIPLTQFVDRISTNDLQQLTNLQRSAFEGGHEVDSIRSTDQVIKQGMVEAGLEPGELAKDSGAGERARAFYRRVDTEAQAFQAANGRKPNSKEIQDIVDRLSIDVVRSRTLPGTSVPYWFRGETPAGLQQVEGVPDALVDELAQAVRDAGAPVTEDNIRKLYNRLQAR